MFRKTKKSRLFKIRFDILLKIRLSGVAEQKYTSYMGNPR